MNLPEPQSTSCASILGDIDKGIIKIPQFQRDFVWTKEKSAKLLDSIIKGYPIGTFILWKTKETLRSIRNLGNATLPSTPKGDYTQYVLDGQQRLTSLYASLKGLTVRRENRDDAFSEIYIDLTASNSDEIVITDRSENSNDEIIRIKDLMAGDISYLVGFPKQFHKKLTEYKRSLESYSFSTILIREATIDVATEIFTRINVTGTPLSVFEIMVAKTFDGKKDFDLSEKYDELLEKLTTVDYETISEATVLQTLSIILKKDCSKKAILKLEKDKFIQLWPEAVDSIFYAVEYFRNYYRIPVSKLLPYNALIVPFAYFFYKEKKKPTEKKQRYLEDFFWRVSLGSRYSHSLETRIAQDIKKIDTILGNNQPRYEYPIDISPQFIAENGYFSTGRSYIKAMLCVFAYFQPKSFIDNSIVRISNDWLKQANSKNYHHFFPRAYLKKKGFEEDYINHIANITIVDDYLNKREIGHKAPSKYMRKFSKLNAKIESTLKTHLVNLNSFGVWEDDYDLFFKKRCNAISKVLKKRILEQGVDSKGQEVNLDDREESELEA